MSETFALKPTHKAVRAYYLVLAQLANVGAKHETAVREAWHNLIEAAAGPRHWTLVREYAISRKGAAPLRLDGALLDEYRLVHGCLEAKDDADDLAAEMRAKLKLGYPAKNTIFWQPRRALLVQNGKVALDVAIDTKPEQLVEILAQFFAYVVSARKRAVFKIARDFGLILRAGFVKLAGGAARWGGFYGKSSRCGHTAPLASFA